MDILFRTEAGRFSCRAAVLLVHEGRVLLQQAYDDPGFAFPGGHVEIGETMAQALTREMKEEIGADIRVGACCWSSEVFFTWGDSPCHQLCLFFLAELADPAQVPLHGSFWGMEQLEGKRFKLKFTWLTWEEVCELRELYPVAARQLITPEGVIPGHFVDREEPFTIHHAKEEDLADWMYLLELVRNGLPGLDNEASVDAHRRFVQGSIRQGTALCARQNGIIVGILPYTMDPDTICFLAVHPGYRRRGIARALVQAALPHFAGDVALETFVEEDPRAVAPRALYASLGFVPCEVLEDGLGLRQVFRRKRLL